METAYNPSAIESKWYAYWLERKLFESKVDDREPYTIVIPPPNVTGVLHMGHMLNNTIQDVLIRRARLQQKNACWVPGTDHASIATEAKVVARLKQQGIAKETLSREEFLKHAWDWTEEYGGVILAQLKRLGASCDWSRTTFTMDQHMYDSVIEVFIDLYEKGHIYRGYRMVNWDPEAKTTLSDEEVIYQEREGNLYYIQYAYTDGSGALTVATTRPETIFGDVAICVNPEDPRYSDKLGKTVFVPIVNREIPIISDTYVDAEFGTGCLKITPAHDQNDKAIGDKYNLEIIDALNSDATLNAHSLHYEGLDRFEARPKIAEELQALGLLLKVEKHLNKVGTSERTGAVIEPRLLDQWFLKMEELVKPAIDAVLKNGEIKLHPSKFDNTYKHWLENIRDWNISRQLWWGQQIPAFYYDNTFVVAKSLEEALEKANERAAEQQSNKRYTAADLRQDEDVLDTWFSSWLWPISVFNGILEPDNKEINYYYPTSDLVTGPDILFFWVARMIISGYEYRKTYPFKNVYLTGLVRDKQGRKMSKSLGNSPDALGLIDTYGADAVRVGLLLSSAAGNDLLFDESLCQQGRNFANKIWNAFRLITSWEGAPIAQPEANKIGIEWFNSQFNSTLDFIEDQYAKYRISDALMALYKLIWDDYCSWLLELIKPAYQQPVDEATKKEAFELMERLLVLLHPFMPFLTEELWQQLDARPEGSSICVAHWPQSGPINQPLIGRFNHTQSLISALRTMRKEKHIKPKEILEIQTQKSDHLLVIPEVLSKLGFTSSIEIIESAGDNTLSVRVETTEYYIPFGSQINVEEEVEKLQKELTYQKGFLEIVNRKLTNKRFVDGAPDEVVAAERKKAADAQEKIQTIEITLSKLG
ncbi:MAG: valine--tRNA ligase [Bacteroidetes bacterium]|nr:valine--tRNA ligase [Bacteroidota bacterium]MDA0950217.1 valine--tRNA ligase [Bacteroidota bacterium]